MESVSGAGQTSTTMAATTSSGGTGGKLPKKLNKIRQQFLTFTFSSLRRGCFPRPPPSRRGLVLRLRLHCRAGDDGGVGCGGQRGRPGAGRRRSSRQPAGCHRPLPPSRRAASPQGGHQRQRPSLRSGLRPSQSPEGTGKVSLLKLKAKMQIDNKENARFVFSTAALGCTYNLSLFCNFLVIRHQQCQQ